MLEAWLGLERRVEMAGRNDNFLGAKGVRCRRQELGQGFFFFLLAVLHGIQGLSSLTGIERVSPDVEVWRPTTKPPENSLGLDTVHVWVPGGTYCLSREGCDQAEKWCTCL